MLSVCDLYFINEGHDGVKIWIQGSYILLDSRKENEEKF